MSFFENFQKYLFLNWKPSVIREWQHEKFKISMRVTFKTNFDKISTLKILKSIFIKFSFQTQFQLINILSMKCFKEIYFHKITKPFDNNLLIINYL